MTFNPTPLPPLQQPTLSDMTMYEMNFSLLVEDTLKNIVLPEYRQIIVEVGRCLAPFAVIVSDGSSYMNE